ncbi:putative sulfate exporter family transporter [Zobellia galactanivorans]|uniref:YeiH family protein n=1 Tax=Zobellia galactanivorans (strain DSM 12802 / CCUG 47099 / CIP 106680 / NCIMB 13871 / Dsij) TaxID=63186 RepID=UPI0026E2294D|nr:putative sulfate exporter family transporter [Zobellia galactanivorans]MDO6809218.1 putative sulfate exporter family transporter [Zobellia galactanivorans]
MKDRIAKITFLLMALIVFSGWVNSPTALLLGFGFTLFFNNPFKAYCHKAIHSFLKVSVVGLGFGMFIKETLETGKEGFMLTFLSITLTVGLGFLLTKALKLDKKLGHLITSGTSVCGGSAIAAISPVINAKSKAISIALAVVFLLNSIALFVFPAIGHYLHLSQHQFGLWCAVAIHDTSSVIGASIGYGDEALRTATTVKLSRMLWIVPLSILSMFVFKTKGEKVKMPYFILLFIGAIILNSYHLIPAMASLTIVSISKKLLILTLFLVGSTLSIEDLRATGTRPMVLAVLLWVFISALSLLYILY